MCAHTPLHPLAAACARIPAAAVAVCVQIKVLQERLTWCYLKEGVNHLENCKELAAALHSKVTAHYHGVKGAPGKYVA